MADEGITESLQVRALVEVMGAGRHDDASTEVSGIVLTPGAAVGIVKNSLIRQAEQGPLIVLLDDAQWGKYAVELAQSMLDSSVAVPILLVLTVRSESVDDLQLGESLETDRSLSVVCRIATKRFPGRKGAG